MKVYVITGAGHFPGTGSCLAEYLLKTGNNVAINSRTFDDRWADILGDYPDNLAIVSGDITDTGVQQELIDTAIETWGRIDCLVNNASTVETSTTPSREEWNREFLLNVTVPYELSVLAEEYLTITQGSIIMIGSRAGLQVVARKNNNNLAYSVAKSAEHHLTKSLAVMLAPNIRVNAVALGMFDSARSQHKFGDQQSAMIERYKSNSLTNTLVDADSLIESIVFLANNKNITGQVLPVCGGASVHK
jgi:NAD(P)-dependent dehydrogenase (short-subunit alcohol dehydrogenase family)